MRTQLSAALAASLIVVSGALAQSPAPAPSYSGLTADQLIVAAQPHGYGLSRVEGNPDDVLFLQGKAGDLVFTVRGSDCDAATGRCGILLMFATFDYTDFSLATYQRVNSYNDSHYLGRAFVLEEAGAVGIDHTIDMRGGITGPAVDSALASWKAVLGDFLQVMSAQ